MKKILSVLICLSIVFGFSFSTVSAEYHTEKLDVTLINKENTLEDSPLPLFSNPSTEKGGGSGIALKALEIIVTYIGGKIVDQVLIYVDQNKVDMDAVHEWAAENGYDTPNYDVILNRVVYDDGCWSPEFPANPFCKSFSE